MLTSVSLRDSTSSRRATASLANTSTGPSDGQTPRAGGASIRSRHPSTCSRTTRNGKPAEDPMDNRPGGVQEASGPNPGKRPHQDRGAVCRRAVQPGDPRLSRDNGRRKDGRPTGGRRGRRRGQRGLGVGRQRTRGAAPTVEGGGGGYNWRRSRRIAGFLSVTHYILLSFLGLYCHPSSGG